MHIEGLTGDELELEKLTQLVRFDGLERFVTYYWRVAAENYRGKGDWSEARSFVISPPELVFKGGFE